MSIIDVSEKDKSKWLKQCSKALEELMMAECGTIFDSHLFHDQFPFVLCQASCKFVDIEETPFKRIRSNRLKLLGYTWDGEKKEWNFELQTQKSGACK